MGHNRLAFVKKWGLYYGCGRPAGLGECDLAVVAPEGWDRAAVAALRAGGTRVLAYISVLEVPRSADQPAPAGVLRNGAEPVVQAAWQNWVLDPRRPETADRLYRLAAVHAEAGYDGFFLDTVADVEGDPVPPAMRPLLTPAAARLIAGLRERHPARLLVQNWGFGPMLALTLPYVDGICWEDFPTGAPQPWQTGLAQRLATVQRHGVRVLALSHRPADAAAAWAAQLGFPWYGAPGSYIEWDGEAGR